MSRVFEALVKASEEKQSHARGSGRGSESLFRNAARPVNPTPVIVQPNLDGSVVANDRRNDLPYVQFTATNKSKSWRERIQELFFGWDLGRYKNNSIVSLERDSAASEQYKILREQIKRLRLDEGIGAFSITSPVKRDGKTTVAVNLAAVLALDYEERVILIDGDLRAPGVHSYFSVPLSPGLGDYLSSSSSMSVKDLVRDTFLPGLRIIPAGRPSHLSSELLAKENMKQLLDELRLEFPGHQIIIDSPPILSTPDPIVLARLVDGVLLVIRAGKTPRECLTKALQSLNSTKLMGIVLNGADLGFSSKYYHYTTDAT